MCPPDRSVDEHVFRQAFNFSMQCARLGVKRLRNQCAVPHKQQPSTRIRGVRKPSHYQPILFSVQRGKVNSIVNIASVAMNNS